MLLNTVGVGVLASCTCHLKASEAIRCKVAVRITPVPVEFASVLTIDGLIGNAAGSVDDVWKAVHSAESVIVTDAWYRPSVGAATVPFLVEEVPTVVRDIASTRWKTQAYVNGP